MIVVKEMIVAVDDIMRVSRTPNCSGGVSPTFSDRRKYPRTNADNVYASGVTATIRKNHPIERCILGSGAFLVLK